MQHPTFIHETDTPAVLIDIDRVAANLARAQAYADAHGLRLRPHIKTHKLPRFAQAALDLGAVGITCQKVGEAEVMAQAGIADIFLPYNILGADKLARLLALHRRIAVSVSADSAAVVQGYAQVFTDAAHPLPVLVECDTGAGRCGVQDAAQVVALAQVIAAHPGLRFEGIMTYPPRGAMAAVQDWLQAALAALEAAGLPAARVSNGGSPDLYACAAVTAATEHRPGTYIYSDRMQVAFGLGTLADCALTVLATVVSRPTADRVVLDAGSKALAADLAPVPGHGHIMGYPGAVIQVLSEEHATADFSACPDRPEIGARLRIIPNHACVVSNLFDTVHLVQGDRVIERVDVAARGKLG